MSSSTLYYDIYRKLDQIDSSLDELDGNTYITYYDCSYTTDSSWNTLTTDISVIGIAVSDNGDIWACGEDNILYKLENNVLVYDSRSDDISNISITGDGKYIFICQNNTLINYYDTAYNSRHDFPAGKMKFICISSDGNHLWGINHTNKNLWYTDVSYDSNGVLDDNYENWSSKTSTLNPSYSMVAVSENSNHVYAITEDQEIYYGDFDGETLSMYKDDSIDISCINISVSKDGNNVWAVTANGIVYYKCINESNIWHKYATSPMNYPMSYIVVLDADTVYGIGTDGLIYKATLDKDIENRHVYTYTGTSEYYDISSAMTNINSALISSVPFYDNTNYFLQQANINTKLKNEYQKVLLNNIDNNNDYSEKDTNNKIRMTRINLYYKKKQDYINKVLKYSIFFIFIILILVILNKCELLSTNILFTMVTIILIIYGILLFRDYSNYISRSNFDFDEINHGRIDPSSNFIYAEDGCFAADCCVSGETIYDYLRGECILDCDYIDSGTIYDYTKGECIQNTDSTDSSI